MVSMVQCIKIIENIRLFYTKFLIVDTNINLVRKRYGHILLSYKITSEIFNDL